ncbi:chemoreceptor glutamine deamidase CheD [Nitrosomonas mobilis]|uniref:Probable chemoreceptor glutamine deamidase CheD n=1 Tax=Nitrosomonas mobilis TaxID=51642 RepID=A0A1G5SFQ7_9PROT|nr:chemoreceptor glutamine deamidase CheD [Nitrosomonas mobilis]SCZ86035.1 putative chemoreceptor glutamine deamidase CheD [Nitrosomonas mobilis]
MQSGNGKRIVKAGGPDQASNFYYDQYLKLEAVKLLPGEYYVTTRDMVLSTVLGSCVSACIYDFQSGIGGMNHFMLPAGKDNHGAQLPSARFGDSAMEILLREILKRGARRANLVAKVFGGGNVQRTMVTTHIGFQNAKFVKEYLARHQIRILAADLVGFNPRKIHFFPRSGKVLMKKLYVLHNDTIVQREQRYNRMLLMAAKTVA